MTSLKEGALAYEGAAKTKNIADLNKVSTNLELRQKTINTKDGQKTFDVIFVEGEEYRVPKTVLKSLKIILEDNPSLKEFKVKRTGTTKDDTSYTVIPLS
jgi:hypothetical protein